MPSTLSREQEHALAIAIRHGSAEARDALVLASQGLVKRLAAKYGHSAIPRADVIQEGNLGLLRAIQDYDPDHGRFSTYATWWIRSAMIALILGNGDVIRIPPHHWRVRHQETISDGMVDRLEASEAVATIFPLRADQPAVPPDDLTERHEDISLITTAIDRLNPVESFILRARFGLGQKSCTREVVAAQTGLSVAWVAKIQRGAVEKLRVMLDSDQPEKKEIKHWRIVVNRTTYEFDAWTKSEARAMLKAMFGIDRKGRLPKGTVVEEVMG